MAVLPDKARFNLDKALVLLIEPHASGMDILSQIFAGFGVHQPRRAESVDEAMGLAKANVFDLIVCDAAMPDGGAYDFISSLRRSNLEPNRYCPVIVIAGHTPAALVAKARDCGANFVVTKPLTPRVLLERIIWISQEARPFIEMENYIGPDRRFQNLGPPPGAEGRRREDMVGDLADANQPNLSQGDIDSLLNPIKAQL